MTDELTLKVTIPAAEWAALQRRVLYLEATIIQLLREGQSLKEWFSATELAALRLPGLPVHKNAMTRLARVERWLSRPIRCQGGVRLEYHFSVLPRRAFEALVERVLKGPAPAGAKCDAGDLVPELPAPPDAAIRSEVASPPWLLPLILLQQPKRQRLEHKRRETINI